MQSPDSDKKRGALLTARKKFPMHFVRDLFASYMKNDVQIAANLQP